MAPAILLIEDEAILAKNVKRFLERQDYDVRIAGDGADGLRQFDAFKPDLVLLDFHLPGGNGLDVLGEIRKRDRNVKVILVTGHGSVQLAVDAMKAGAYDYLSKPLVLSELKLVIDKALGQERLEGALSYYRDKQAEDSGIDKILGDSAPMAQLKQRIGQLLEAERRMVDGTPPAVLITGETGTGKELVARAIHFDGPRRERPFVELNCAAIPTHLLESELFGYERGAFTDARERKIGLVESAHGGTLFLDEIGDLDATVQVKLLKLLEDKTVRRLGSVRDNRVDIRIVTATNCSLEDMIRAGKFRSDLYFRLKVIGVELPPLRDRGQDIVKLAETFLGQHGRRYGRPHLRLSAEARIVLLQHPWPGNVRELRNVIEQSVLLAEDDIIGPEQLPLQAARLLVEEPAPATNPEGDAASAAIASTLEDVERDLILRALARSGGNVTLAARALGISRDTLRYRMKKHNPRLQA